MAESGPERVQRTLHELGLDIVVETLPNSTRTAREAAETLGCTVAEIAKSLVFRRVEADLPVLAVMSGINRVDVDKLAGAVGETLGKANAEFVRRTTGYAIGGVPPIGHGPGLLAYLDEDLFRFETVWAAGGSPFSIFEIAPKDLEKAMTATRSNLKEQDTEERDD